MEQKEILQALECCSRSASCTKKCILYENGGEYCESYLMKQALELIKTQMEEIKKLKK